LNRTNRSGIIQGGVIGGKNQNGPYKIGARFNRQDLIQRIRRIGRYRSRISIYNQDAADLIRNTLPDLPSRTLAYLDPPYYVKGKGLYRNYYEHADHTQIAALISNTNQRWIVSYDNAPEVRDLYSRFRSIAYDLHYSAANRYEGSEVMFFCDELVLPASSSPTEVSSQTVDGAN